MQLLFLVTTPSKHQSDLKAEELLVILASVYLKAG